MALPRAVVLGRVGRRRLAAAAVATEPLHELVAEGADAGLEVVEVLGGPGGPVGTGDGVGAGEGDVEDVVVVVAAVPRHALAVAGGGEGDGGLADHGEVAVVAVHVAPDAVEELVAADDGDEAQGLDAAVAGVEGGPARGVARVAEDDVGVGVGVEVLLAGAVALDEVLEGGDGEVGGVVVAAAVVGGAALDAVAAYVHVGEGAGLALDVEHIGGLIGAVVEAWERVLDCRSGLPWLRRVWGGGERVLTASAAVDAVEAAGQDVVALAAADDGVVEVADVLGHVAGRGEACGGGEDDGRRRGGESGSHWRGKTVVRLLGVDGGYVVGTALLRMYTWGGEGTGRRVVGDGWMG